jgi:hypothetical protein
MRNKITNIRQLDNKMIVVEGEFILINEIDWEKSTGSILVGKTTTTVNVRPFIISRTEKIEKGDKIYHEHSNTVGDVIDIVDDDLIVREEGDSENDHTCTLDRESCFKVLAGWGNFSNSDRYAIAAEVFLKKNDKVFIECEIHDEWLKENPPFSGPYTDQPYYQLKFTKSKLSKPSYVKLHPYQEMTAKEVIMRFAERAGLTYEEAIKKLVEFDELVNKIPKP